jgi:hypothetical protein
MLFVVEALAGVACLQEVRSRPEGPEAVLQTSGEKFTISSSL